MSNFFWLTDAQMARLEPFFPESHGKPRVDDQRVLSGIIFINRDGLRLSDAPREYGKPKTLCNRWKRWGVTQKVVQPSHGGLFCYRIKCLKQGMALHEIDTERLLLRGWKPEDHAPFAAMCGDPDVMRYIGNGATRTAEDTARCIRSFEKEWTERGFGLFAVEAKQTGDLIGFTGLSWPGFLPEVLPSVEIGWRFSKQSWGQGYASEAASAALAFGVDELGITDIVSICQIGNGASARIMQKLGMIFDRRTIDPTCEREVVVYHLPQN